MARRPLDELARRTGPSFAAPRHRGRRRRGGRSTQRLTRNRQDCKALRASRIYPYPVSNATRSGVSARTISAVCSRSPSSLARTASAKTPIARRSASHTRSTGLSAGLYGGSGKRRRRRGGRAPAGRPREPEWGLQGARRDRAAAGRVSMPGAPRPAVLPPFGSARAGHRPTPGACSGGRSSGSPPGGDDSTVTAWAQAWTPEFSACAGMGGCRRTGGALRRLVPTGAGTAFRGASELGPLRR